MYIKEIGKLLSKYISGIIITDKEEQIVWANKMVKEIHYSNDLYKKYFYELFSFSVNEVIKKNKIYSSPIGKIYNIKAEKIKDDNREYFIIIIEDIENFNNEKIKLYALEEIISSINDGIIMSDSEGKIILYNNAQERLEELQSKEVVGKYLWEAYNYKQSEISEHRKVFKTGKPLIDKYRAHSYKDGIPKYVSYSTYPIKKDGETIAVYSISKNETMIKSLLSDIIELKRKLRDKDIVKNQEYTNGTNYTFKDMKGNSEDIKDLIKEAQTMATLKNNMLIVGETGTGKEVFAQSIHNYSKDKDKPFVAINCAAIPENLLESILFGTVKGSYTGAIDQVGLFEEAGEGTLFLDELNSMSINMQTKLLRVLQERKVRRVGSLNSIPIHCRVISAVNEDPENMIKENRLRQDLFYRVAGLSLYISPLRERTEDILEIGKFFINKYNNLLSKNVRNFSNELKDELISYNWPGNIRELEHVIENLMIRVDKNEKELRIEHLPKYIQIRIIGKNANNKLKKKKGSLSQTLRDIEKQLILESLNKNEWNVSKSSEDLGIIRQSLIYRMKKLEIDKK